MPKSLSRHPLSSHSMVSDFMLSSFLLLIFHMKKKLYHGISVLFKIDQSGLVGFCLFVCFFEGMEVGGLVGGPLWWVCLF